MEIDFQSLKEDLRKLGVILIAGGLVAFVLNTPPVSYINSIYAILSGVFLYGIGVFKKKEVGND